ncbi:MAG: hypothetical protein FJ403_23395 [Verrucomicrobia bacterium]|nr:hypothetical protein [Verrucomicrobiota bacterium]
MQSGLFRNRRTSGAPLRIPWREPSANGVLSFVLCSLITTLSCHAQTNTLILGWGRNDEGQISPPVGLANATAIASGWNHALALESDGTVTAWGANANKQTALPSGLSGVIRVSAGQFHSLAVKADGSVVAWGGNLNGQTTVPSSASNCVAVAAGGNHSLALRRNGTVIGWGDNALSQSSPPAGLSNVLAIAAGHFHSMALKSDGTVVAWGKVWNGLAFVDPTPPAGLTNVTRIAAGHFHCLAVKSDGTVVGWGDNSNGQSSIPAGLNTVVAVTGGRYHSIALRSNGTVVGWGNNVWGQAAAPTSVTSVSGVAAGTEHSLALQAPAIPTIIVPPGNQTVLSGKDVTFSVLAAGTAPLAYQWLKDGTAIKSATDPVLTLTAVKFSDAGSYAVQVSNPAGTTTAAASLTVGPVVQLVGTNTSGGLFSIPVQVTAAGGENAFGFSLSFDTTIMKFTNAVVGTGAVGAGMNINTNQLSTGKLGVALALPSGTSLSQGQFEIAVINFICTNISVSTESSVKFDDKPLAKQVSDVKANILTAAFKDGTLNVVSGVEGDTDSDGLISVVDVTKIGRIAARIDVTGMTNGLLQRADCAPLSTKGDGKIGIDDWVQAGRFAAGLDAKIDAGGLVPTSASLTSLSPENGRGIVRKSRGARILQIQSSPFNAGEPGNIKIQFGTQGQENSVGFTLQFDPTKLTFASATAGDLTSGTLFLVNSNKVKAGQLGVVIALPAGMSFPVGLHNLVGLSFEVNQNVSGDANLDFCSDLVVLAAASVTAAPLPLQTSPASLKIIPAKGPRLQALLAQGQGLRLRITNWDGTAMAANSLPNMDVYTTEDIALPLSRWERLPSNFKVVGGDLLLEESNAVARPQRFFRVVTKP